VHVGGAGHADNIDILASVTLDACLQCFDAVGWAAGRASGLKKN